MDIYAQIVQKIIEQQETIIGPVAVQQAQLVSGLSLDWPNHAVSIKGNEKQAVDSLIEQYKELFGQIAVEVSKEAVANIATKLSADQLPELLK